MEGLDLAVLLEPHPRAATLDQPRARRQQEGFDVRLVHRARYGIAEDGFERLAVAVVHPCG